MAPSLFAIDATHLPLLGSDTAAACSGLSILSNVRAASAHHQALVRHYRPSQTAWRPAFEQVGGLTVFLPPPPASLRTASQALFLASTTKLFFLSLGLIWRSVTGAEGAAPIIGLSIEDLILQAIEFASRAAALSGACRPALRQAPLAD